MYVAILSGAATIPGFALHYVFGNKMKGAEEDCGDQGISFLPILADSLGETKGAHAFSYFNLINWGMYN